MVVEGVKRQRAPAIAPSVPTTRASAGLKTFTQAEEPDNSARVGTWEPDAAAIAAALLKRPDVLEEIIRRAAWIDIPFCERLREAIEAAMAHRAQVEASCREATFGRDFVAGGEPGDEARLGIAGGDAAVESYQRTVRREKKARAAAREARQASDRESQTGYQ